MHICISALKNCINLEDSYGEICVHCNCCGRINEETKLQAQFEHYKRQLQQQHDFDNWVEGWEETQRKNIKSNIEYYEKKIAKVERLLSERDEFKGVRYK